MWQTDAMYHHSLPTEQLINNNDIINVEAICSIDSELQDNVYDMTSLVFLLYEVPDTALQKLIVYQRVSKDAAGTNLNLLHEWYQHAKTRSTWKQEFIEALLTCQLYNIVRRLGLHVPTMKRYYQSDVASFSMYINPLKKLLYKACENMTSDNLAKLKRSLKSYNVDMGEHDVCELIFLELMCQKFIKANYNSHEKKMLTSDVNVENLARIMFNLPGLRNIAIELRDLQDKTDKEVTVVPSTSQVIEDSSMLCDEPGFDNIDDKYSNVNLEDIMLKFGNLNLDHLDNKDLKSDTTKLYKDGYKIKDPNRVGLCLIINQENFFPSKYSIENYNQKDSLDPRLGSTVDKLVLEKTMTELNFMVYSYSDLDHKEMIQCIKRGIKNINRNDSIFMLCILSHGVRGHVFAADSVKIKVEKIQHLLDSDEAKHLRGMPKVLIIQACQVDDKSECALVADGISDYHLKKSDFLVYWASAPEYEAYRHEKHGSLFIQLLCKMIKRYAKRADLNDIFTKVTNAVTGLCTKLERAQVPLFESTLRKKLYLQIPG